MQYFQEYRKLLVGLPISHIWRGHGSAIFLELGTLSSGNEHCGSPDRPAGEFTVMLPWSWRIEKPRSILGGSWSTDGKIDRMVSQLRGYTITDVALFGRLPELDLTLSNGFHVLSFMTAEGQPEWAIICPSPGSTLCVKRGRLALESLGT